MTFEYEIRALGVHDLDDGKKLLVGRTTDGKTIRLILHTHMADFVVKQIGAPVEP